MVVNTADKSELKAIKRIYKKSFPFSERVPFRIILRGTSQNKIRIMTISEDNTIIGFFVLFLYKDLVLIAYFAIDDKERGKGRGSKALTEIRRIYPNKRIFLEIEIQDAKAKNSEQRKKRKAFYSINGYTELGLYSDSFFGKLELLGYDCEVSLNEYRELNKNTLGIIYNNIINPKVIKNSKK